MTTQNIGLFQAIGSKIDFLDKRQQLISQNIANSDTPGYRPMDVKELDFSSLVERSLMGSGKPMVRPETTQSEHIGTGPKPDDPKSGKQRFTYEVAPAGNAVVIEEQMIKSGETVTDYSLMLNVYRKNIGMLKTAIGK